MAVKEIMKPEELSALIESGKPLVVMFSAGWCGDCKALDPHFEKYSETLEKADVAVVKIVLSSRKELVGDKMKPAYITPEHEALRKEYAKSGFPTVVFFKEGRVFSSTLEDTEVSLRRVVDYVLSRIDQKASCTSGCSVGRPSDVRNFWKPRENLLGEGRVHRDSRFRGRQPVF
jgi:thiol-disulfide isomerase/thioredoxin